MIRSRFSCKVTQRIVHLVVECNFLLDWCFFFGAEKKRSCSRCMYYCPSCRSGVEFYLREEVAKEKHVRTFAICFHRALCNTSYGYCCWCCTTIIKFISLSQNAGFLATPRISAPHPVIAMVCWATWTSIKFSRRGSTMTEATVCFIFYVVPFTHQSICMHGRY